MKYLIFILFLSPNFLFSQEISKNEYVIYGQLLNEFYYPVNKFRIGLSANERGSLLVAGDPVEVEISKVNSVKKFDSDKLESIISKFRLDKRLNRNESDDPIKDSKISITCSPVYFKNDVEAYIYIIMKIKNVKLGRFLLKATKAPDGYWCLNDYMLYY